MSAPSFDIIKACSDPNLFGLWFRDKSTWKMWLVFLAALFALEPRYLTRRLSGTERDTWLRLVGTAAHLPQGTSIALFAPRINANWQSAVTQLRGMGAIFEDASART